MKLLTSFCSLLLLFSSAFAQISSTYHPRTCGTMEHMEHQFKKHPEFEKKWKAQQAKMLAISQNPMRTTSVIITIPVVVHNVYKNATDSITMNDVLSQIDSMNKDFRRLNADYVSVPAPFQTVGADVEIEFCLATKDPTGAPTTGLTYTKTTQSSFSTNDDIKHNNTGGKDAWPANEYLNIWVGDLGGGLLGYAQFPGGPAAEDGVVIGYNCFGSQNPNLLPAYNLGRTAPHEIGHWLGLRHIWGDAPGCSPDDNITDTPVADDANYGCQQYPFITSCQTASPGEMFMNYMDYGDDNCITMFTNGQKNVMRALFDAGGDRYDLGLSAATKCNIVPPVPVADAVLLQINAPQNNDSLCSGKIIPQIVMSNIGNLSMTSAVIEYTINGGSPVPYSWTGQLDSGQVTTLSLPQVNLPTGNYNLTITITQSNGQPDVPATNNSQTVSFVVLNATGFPLPFFQGFEIGVFPQNNMTIFNPNNNITWELTDTASALGTKSVVIRNFNNTPIGSIDELRMPMLDFSNTIQPKIEFDYAYTSFTSGASDTLEVLVSTDCGRNYQVVGLYLGGSLVTAPASTSYFVPNELQWKHKSINLLPYAGEPAVRISFRNKNSHENNLYLDNLNIYGASTDISGSFAEAISVFPNPAISAFTLSYLATDKGQLAANLSDITGRVVAQYSYDYNQGNNQWEIPVQNLPSGVYLLTLDQGDAHLTLRIMVQ